MKKTNILLGALLLTLASCEMKDELLGKDSSTETGALELALSVPDRTPTRAVDTDDFTVTITDTENAENTYKYVYSEMENPIRLSVGNYRVTAHSAGDIAPIMSEAYYGGSTSTDLVITPGVTAQTTVECKMMNTQLSLSYGEDFLAAFKSWTITLDDGNAHIHTITGESGTATGTSWFWYIAESQPSELTLNVIAITTDDQTIRETKKLRKADAEESYGDDTDYFAGGDNLNITLGAIDEDETEPENGSIGIVIEADITFAGTDDTVEIPVEDVPDEEEPEQPEQPGGDEETNPDLPTMQMPSNGHITYTLNSSDQPASADVVINAPKGLKSLNVKIVAGNDGFEAVIADLINSGLDFVNNGVEMVGNEFISTVLGSFLGEGATVSAPAIGDTSYTFPVGAFFNLMNTYEATAPNAHVFKMVLEDQAGNKIEGELSVTINPAS